MIECIRSWVVKWLKKEKPLPQTPLSDFERIRYELKPCDIILVEGRSRVSEVIKLITQSSWSHAALYIGRLNEIEDATMRVALARHYQGDPDVQLLIESELGLGTVVRSITVYEGEHLRLCRPRALSYGDQQQVLQYAIGRLGTAYDVRQVFDLARFLFPWFILPRWWRSSLFSTRPGGNTHTVCSTMIAEAFGHIRFPILPLVKKVEGGEVQLFMRNPKLCTPSDFDYSPYFDIIKYPFLDFQHHSEPRLLPWRGRGTLSEEEYGMYLYHEEDDPSQAETRDNQ
jgi:hypothetical protein